MWVINNINNDNSNTLNKFEKIIIKIGNYLVYKN